MHKLIRSGRLYHPHMAQRVNAYHSMATMMKVKTTNMQPMISNVNQVFCPVSGLLTIAATPAKSEKTSVPLYRA